MSDARQEWRWRMVRRCASVMTGGVVLLGLTVLVGWWIDSPALKRVHPGLPAMVPATAVGLLLVSVALLCLRAGPRGVPWARLIALGVTGGCATQFILSVSRLVWGAPRMLTGNWMSEQTAITFVLLGGALLCAGRTGRANTWTPWLALASLLPPLIALTGYVFLERRFYATSSDRGMALHTAVALLFLSTGVLALQPERGPMRVLLTSTAGGVMARRMLSVLLLPLGVGGIMSGLVRADLLDVNLSDPLFAVTMMGAFAAILWRGALALDHFHAEQVKAEQQARDEAERQRALAAENARLYQAAQEAARGREEVLAMVSHDLKNPLSTIRLSTQLLSSRLAGTPQEALSSKQVGAIERAVAHMLTLIHRLLDAARLDAGQALAISPRVEPLAPLLAEALALIEPQAARKSLRLEQEAAARLEAHLDRDRILQVLANLLGNAVKFTPEGGTVRVEAHAAGDEVRVSVRDTGPGIPEGARTQLFERHWQAEGTASQGSGLGLYISRGIIDAHGGRIWVEDTPGPGTTLRFSLPAAPGARE